MTNAIDPMTLHKAVADIARIEEAGELDRLWEEVHYKVNQCPEALGPRSPWKDCQAEQLAKTSHHLLGAPLADCEKAADAYIGTERQRIVLDVIAEFIRELDGTTKAEPTASGTPAAIARARRPR